MLFGDQSKWLNHRNVVVVCLFVDFSIYFSWYTDGEMITDS